MSLDFGKRSSQDMTAIFYPDIVAYSPSRRYRLDIRSPDNDPVAPRHIDQLGPRHLRRFWTDGFQSDFVYTVVSAETEDLLWQRPAAGSLDHPVEAWLTDDGAVVVVTRTGFSSALILLSERGEWLYEADVWNLLGESEPEFHWTSAGSYWTEGGHGLFVLSQGKCFWSFRNLHGRRIVLNVTEGRHEAAAAATLSEIRGAEADWARNILVSAAAESERWQEGTEEANESHLRLAKTAAFWAGCDGLMDTVSSLRRLERVPALHSYTFVSWQTRQGDELLMGRLYLRPVVKLALRMLGEEPVGFSCYSFRLRLPDRDFADCPALNAPERIANRAAKVTLVRPDMNPQDTLELLGVPDFLPSRDSWDYDFVDKDNGFTFRIEWNTATWLPESVRMIRPGAWCNLKDRLFWL